jgi:hypothetical protein
VLGVKALFTQADPKAISMISNRPANAPLVLMSRSYITCMHAWQIGGPASRARDRRSSASAHPEQALPWHIKAMIGTIHCNRDLRDRNRC